MEKDTRILKALILSDGRKGHENQSIAFCKLLKVEYEIFNIKYKNKFFKLLSYVFDFFGIKVKGLYEKLPSKKFDFVIGTGSETYYALKLINKNPIALMAPKGYKNDFYKVFINETDEYKGENVVKMPVNFSYLIPSDLYNPKQKSVGIIIGGNNRIFTMNENIIDIINNIKKTFQNYEIAVTTSPRTPETIENRIERMKFDYKVIFSKNPVNPIGDFAYKCEYIFITMDSVSMISELVSWGNAKIIVIPLDGKYSKYHKFVENLEKKGFLSFYKNEKENIKKTNLKAPSKKVWETFDLNALIFIVNQ